MLGYDADFFATNEREIAFVKWMQIHRPDVSLRVLRFPALSAVAATTRALAEAHLAGLFVVWDTPAMMAAGVLKTLGRKIPMTTVDLGHAAAIGLAASDPLVAIAAQQPFRQGESAASITVTALLGRPAPPGSRFPDLRSPQAMWWSVSRPCGGRQHLKKFSEGSGLSA